LYSILITKIVVELTISPLIRIQTGAGRLI
jgi:hypothetical protein